MVRRTNNLSYLESSLANCSPRVKKRGSAFSKRGNKLFEGPGRLVLSEVEGQSEFLLAEKSLLPSVGELGLT